MTNVDPVCGMTIEDEHALNATFDGVEYRFCCEMCRLAFIGAPERYVQLPSRPHPIRDGSDGTSDLL